MKKLVFIIALVFLSCSKDEEPEVFTQSDLMGTWKIYAIEGNSSLDECDLKAKLEFTPDVLFMTGAYLDNGSCQVFTNEHNYEFDGKLKIAYEGISYFATIKDQNTLEINSRFDGISITHTYKKI